MPQHREAPIASSESAKVASTEVESTPSETESITLSDYDFEVNVVQSATNSTASDDIILELDSVDSGTGFQVPESAPLSPVFELEKFVLPIEYNLRQLLVGYLKLISNSQIQIIFRIILLNVSTILSS